MWDLPRPGLEPVFPALAGRFLTTAPPGKPLSVIFMEKDLSIMPASSREAVKCFLSVDPQDEVIVEDITNRFLFEIFKGHG